MASSPKTETLCNDLLRLWVSSSNYTDLYPGDKLPVQIDHFIEVQHVVSILFASKTVTEDNFFNIPVGQFVDLSTFISGHSNLFRITAAKNQAKKLIPWAAFEPEPAQSSVITAYLASQTTLPGGGGVGPTVGALVRDMALAMKARNTPYGKLTQAVGTVIFGVAGKRAV